MEVGFSIRILVVEFKYKIAIDEYIFSILIGNKERNIRSNYLSVFDWSGEPVIRFETDIDIYRICYNEDDNMLYAIALTEEYDYILVKFDISAYL